MTAKLLIQFFRFSFYYPGGEFFVTNRMKWIFSSEPLCMQRMRNKTEIRYSDEKYNSQANHSKKDTLCFFLKG